MFYGVYMLISKSIEPKYRGKIYIGYTVNPNRRIRQHNAGHQSGGAKKTSNKGPWIMVMIIHGFPNNISALRFEWAWQQPKLSRRLKKITSLKQRYQRESLFNYNFRILSEMLQIGPWNRLPLYIRWISTEYVQGFPLDKIPPMHMTICFGRVTLQKSKSISSDDWNINDKLNCCICKKLIVKKIDAISCVNLKCRLITHLFCLAKLWLNFSGQYIPIEGDCPNCKHHSLWGELIMYKNGMQDNLEPCDNIDDENDDDDLCNLSQTSSS